MNLAKEAHEFLTHFITEEDGIIRQLELPQWVIGVMKSYHDKGYAGYGTATKKVALSRKGTKQGSILGGLLFEAWYDKAIRETKDPQAEQTENWITTKKPQPPWMNADANETAVQRLRHDGRTVDVADIAYADDDQMLVAARPGRPTTRETKALCRLGRWRTSMRKFAFKTNWTKSVIVLSLKGRGARQMRKNIRSRGNKMMMDSTNDTCVPVEQVAKSLGSMISENGTMGRRSPIE